MRVPAKSLWISQCLRERIISRFYHPGEQLPHESDLALEFEVSRKTLRAALVPLESAGLLNRIRGKGTFVQEHEVPVITMLMPCENYILEDSFSARSLRSLFTGVMRGARDYGCRLETTAVSPTNSNRDILPGCFDSIGSESLVIVPGCWFEPMFGLLNRRGARVCLLDSQLLRPEEFPETSSWLQVQEDQTDAYEQCVNHLYARGCHRIAMILEFIRRPGYPKLEGYLRGIRRLGLPDLSFVHPDSLVKDLPLTIGGLYSEHHFDGLIMSCPDCQFGSGSSVNEWLGLPLSLPIIVSHFQQSNWRFPVVPDYFSFDGVSLGHQAVKMLVNPGSCSVLHVESAHFHLASVSAHQGSASAL